MSKAFWGEIYLYPSDIYFTQDSISPFFRNGRSIHDTVWSYIDGRVVLDQGWLMKVVFNEGKYWTLNNRSLWVFQQLQKERICGQIKVLEVEFMLNVWKKYYSTTTGGFTVRIRDSNLVYPRPTDWSYMDYDYEPVHSEYDSDIRCNVPNYDLDPLYEGCLTSDDLNRALHPEITPPKSTRGSLFTQSRRVMLQIREEVKLPSQSKNGSQIAPGYRDVTSAVTGSNNNTKRQQNVRQELDYRTERYGECLSPEHSKDFESNRSPEYDNRERSRDQRSLHSTPREEHIKKPDPLKIKSRVYRTHELNLGTINSSPISSTPLSNTSETRNDNSKSPSSSPSRFRKARSGSRGHPASRSRSCSPRNDVSKSLSGRPRNGNSKPQSGSTATRVSPCPRYNIRKSRDNSARKKSYSSQSGSPKHYIERSKEGRTRYATRRSSGSSSSTCESSSSSGSTTSDTSSSEGSSRYNSSRSRSGSSPRRSTVRSKSNSRMHHSRRSQSGCPRHKTRKLRTPSPRCPGRSQYVSSRHHHYRSGGGSPRYASRQSRNKRYHSSKSRNRERYATTRSRSVSPTYDKSRSRSVSPRYNYRRSRRDTLSRNSALKYETARAENVPSRYKLYRARSRSPKNDTRNSNISSLRSETRISRSGNPRYDISKPRSGSQQYDTSKPRSGSTTTKRLPRAYLKCRTSRSRTHSPIQDPLRSRCPIYDHRKSIEGANKHTKHEPRKVPPSEDKNATTGCHTLDYRPTRTSSRQKSRRNSHLNENNTKSESKSSGKDEEKRGGTGPKRNCPAQLRYPQQNLSSSGVEEQYLRSLLLRQLQRIQMEHGISSMPKQNSNPVQVDYPMKTDGKSSEQCVATAHLDSNSRPKAPLELVKNDKRYSRLLYDNKCISYTTLGIEHGHFGVNKESPKSEEQNLKFGQHSNFVQWSKTDILSWDRNFKAFKEKFMGRSDSYQCARGQTPVNRLRPVDSSQCAHDQTPVNRLRPVDSSQCTHDQTLVNRLRPGNSPQRAHEQTPVNRLRPGYSSQCAHDQTPVKRLRPGDTSQCAHDQTPIKRLRPSDSLQCAQDQAAVNCLRSHKSLDTNKETLHNQHANASVLKPSDKKKTAPMSKEHEFPQSHSELTYNSMSVPCPSQENMCVQTNSMPYWAHMITNAYALGNPHLFDPRMMDFSTMWISSLWAQAYNTWLEQRNNSYQFMCPSTLPAGYCFGPINPLLSMSTASTNSYPRPNFREYFDWSLQVSNLWGINPYYPPDLYQQQQTYNNYGMQAQSRTGVTGMPADNSLSGRFHNNYPSSPVSQSSATHSQIVELPSTDYSPSSIDSLGLSSSPLVSYARESNRSYLSSPASIEFRSGPGLVPRLEVEGNTGVDSAPTKDT